MIIMTPAEKVAFYTLYEQQRIEKCGICHFCKSSAYCSCVNWAKSRISEYVTRCVDMVNEMGETL